MHLQYSPVKPHVWQWTDFWQISLLRIIHDLVSNKVKWCEGHREAGATFQRHGPRIRQILLYAVSASLWVSYAMAADSFLHLWKCGCPSPRVSREAVTSASSLDWSPATWRKGEGVQRGPRATPALFISARESGMWGCGAPGGNYGDERPGQRGSRRGCWTDQTTDVPTLKCLLQCYCHPPLEKRLSLKNGCRMQQSPCKPLTSLLFLGAKI